MKQFYHFICLSCLSISIALLATSNLLAQCLGSEATVVVTIVPDQWANTETSWTLYDSNGALLGSGSPTGATICVPSTACLTYTIDDTYGDGLIQNGGYTVTYNGTTVASGGNFGHQAITQFGVCPAGSSCSFPIVVTEGTYSAPVPNTWYTFTPTATGQYTIDACNNTCSTAIWVYDHCTGIIPTEDQEGTIAFANIGCGDQATLTVNLQGGITYHLRIGDEGTSCANTAINWSLINNGPIVGCMNQTACNYEPLATVSDPSMCIFPGDPNCPDGPDLTVLESVLLSSIYYQTKSNTSSCYINEGCMNGYGTREIIRFTTHIKNIGNQDYFIGAPSTDPTQFEWDDCHNHWHYEGYAEYLLYDINGAAIPIGFKNGFCVLDLECSDGGTAKYGCSNMGITAGCGDIYDSGLNCQWVDITNVAAGVYTLVVRVNWDNSPDKLGRYETDISNNWAQACIQITRNGATTSVALSDQCSPYVDCAGQIYGAATVDCNGICMGTGKAGDLNNDATYTNADRLLYMSAIVQSNQSLSNCNDLNNDDTLTITDPILLNACMHQLDGTHVDADDHCELPTYNVFNPNDTSMFRVISYDPSVQYVDVYLKSPMSYLLGYQFRISGIDIISLETLLPGHAFHTSFNATTGDVAVFSTHEVPIPRYVDYQPILRIYYATPIAEGTTVCLSRFTTVNTMAEETTGLSDKCFVPYLNAQANVWLMGAYNLANSNMNNTLNTNNFLPLSQPFNRTPWAYTGTESVSVMPANAVDWVLVELRDATATTIIERRAALLMQNGEIYDIEGNVGANFYLAARDVPYRLIIRARNHLAVLSASNIILPMNTPLDFSLPTNVAGGAPMLHFLYTDAANIQHYGLRAGDVNANGVITVSDINNYILQMSHSNVYEEGDCNMDGNVLTVDFNYLYSNISAIGVPQVRY